MGIPLDTRSRNGLNNGTERSRNSSSTSSGSLDSATPEEWDRVSKPKHYASQNQEYPDLECIDAIKAACTVDEFRGHCKANVMKYTWRCDHKGATINDLRKARQYLDWLIESYL
jgi:hypothetical protein